MKGLESIALAVAHLEKSHAEDETSVGSGGLPSHCSHVEESNHKEKGRRSPEEEPVPSNEGSTGLFASGAPPTVVVPFSQPFGAASARLVSSDSLRMNAPSDGSRSPPGIMGSLAVVSPTGSTLTSASNSSVDSLEDTIPSSDDGVPDGVPDLTVQELPPAPPPSEVITQVLDNDVLCGRGGETNHHPGNIKYRSLVKFYQPLYIASKRREKPKIAQKIVFTIRERGGRFLKKDNRSNSWRDVGNVKAREKTSQALREGAPELRNGEGEGAGSPVSVPASTTAAVLADPPPPAVVSANSNNAVLMPRIDYQRQPASTLSLPTAAALFMNPRASLDFDHASELKRLLPGLAGLPVPTSQPQRRIPLLDQLQTAGGDVFSSMGVPQGKFMGAAASAPASADKLVSDPVPSAKRMAPVAIRGPRLKRLKSRLEFDSMQGNDC